MRVTFITFQSLGTEADFSDGLHVFVRRPTSSHLNFSRMPVHMTSGSGDLSINDESDGLGPGAFVFEHSLCSGSTAGDSFSLTSLTALVLKVVEEGHMVLGSL